MSSNQSIFQIKSSMKGYHASIIISKRISRYNIYLTTLYTHHPSQCNVVYYLYSRIKYTYTSHINMSNTIQREERIHLSLVFLLCLRNHGAIVQLRLICKTRNLWVAMNGIWTIYAEIIYNNAEFMQK